MRNASLLILSREQTLGSDYCRVRFSLVVHSQQVLPSQWPPLRVHQDVGQELCLLPRHDTRV